MKHKVLIVEDEIAMATTLAEFLSSSPYITSMAHNGDDALRLIAEQKPACVLLDLNLPDMHGFDVLKAIQKTNSGCATVVITGQASMSTAVEAMQRGAHDFISKPASPERLKVCVKNAIESTQLKEIVKTYEKTSREGFADFVGKSPQMQAVYTILENAAQSKASIFITGESGTGKELAARAAHDLSERSEGPFEVLNCAAIPHNLLESEIFGHVKGAFTGATSDREGAATRADGGTLFLDELGEMPIELQAKLLRFIQLGTFMPVGDRRMQEVDVRFICATNRNPLAAVKEGLLREDLYYRLNVIPIHLPPLRERGDDIMRLARHFLAESAREEHKHFTNFTPEAEAYLLRYDWPGNVRELENTIRRVAVLNDASTVGVEMLNMPEGKAQALPEAQTTPAELEALETVQTPPYLPQIVSDIKPLSVYEREVIQAALQACDGNITKAARLLEINPATIHRKQKQWQQDDFSRPAHSFSNT